MACGTTVFCYHLPKAANFRHFLFANGVNTWNQRFMQTVELMPVEFLLEIEAFADVS